MKIKEVILEAPANYNSTAYTNSPVWNNMGPSARSPSGVTIPLWPSSNHAARTGSTTLRPRADRESGKRAAALTKQKNIRQLIDKLWFGGVPGKGGKNIINPRMKAILDSKYTKTKMLARGVRFLQLLGYMEFAEQWWKDRAALVVMHELPEDDPQYEEMHLTDEEFDMYTRRLAEEFVVKVAASAIMPGIVRWFIRTVTFARFFAALFGAAGGVTAVASITLLITSEAAMMAFQNWLNSEPGKLAVSKAVAYLIDPTVGYFEAGLTSIWDRIKSLVTGEEKKKPDAKPTDKPAGKETPTTGTTSTDTGTTKPAGQAARPANTPKTDWSSETI